jgi:hypothetical protein
MKNLKIGIAIAIIATLLISTVPNIMGSSIDTPETIDPWKSGNGNFEASQIDYPYGFKIEGYTSGDYTVNIDGLDYTITINSYSTDLGMAFDWSTTYDPGFSAVIVKGGPSANIYDYETPTMADTFLHSPVNPKSGYYYGISHITFCWGDDYIPPTEDDEVEITGYKFYDANVNGVDDSEPKLADWEIKLYIKNNLSWDYVDTTTTDQYGDYSFIVVASGEYKVEETVPSGWIQTAPATGTWIFTVTIGEDTVIDSKNFGNVYLINGYGGYTQGYWSNKNGQAKIVDYSPDSIDVVKEIYGLDEILSAEDIKGYLTKNSRAKDMSVMLTTQLIATVLNKATGSWTGDEIVYVATIPNYVDYVPSGFITINNIIDEANTALESGNRVEQTFWKNVCDGLNNNWLQFVSLTPP